MNRLARVAAAILAGGTFLTLLGVASEREGPAGGCDGSGHDFPGRPGEQWNYTAKLGAFKVGQGFLRFEGTDSIRGLHTHTTRLHIDARLMWWKRFKFDMQSWFDPTTFASHRFVKRDDHPRFYEIYPDERRWERTDKDDSGKMITSLPLDDLSAIQFVRTLDLTPGMTCELPRYFKEDGNPIILKVLRRDTVEVPAGTFATVVVRPIIKTDGIFSDGGKAELHFTDDGRRMLVFMKAGISSVPTLRSMTLRLTGSTPGGESPADSATAGAGTAAPDRNKGR